MQTDAQKAAVQRQNQRAAARQKRRRNRRIWRNCVSVMACIVVFCVTYALILPAITMEKDTFCGIQAHVHEAQCYEGSVLACDPGVAGLPVLHTHDTLCYEGEELLCTLPELSGHVHTDACYETHTIQAHTHDESCSGYIRGELICTTAEETGHTHSEACNVPGETLLCTEAEQEGHTHADGCYAVGSELTCTLAEGEGHAHADGCYTTEDTLTCTLAEDEDHSHDVSCHTQTERLTCTIPEAPAHAHEAGCYSETKTLTCQTPEDPGHAHTAACFEQVIGCGQEEKEGHTHTEACYEQVSTITCGKEEIAEAVTVHDLICTQNQIAPHTHDGSCSDESGNLICTIQDAVVHQHTEACIQPSQREEDLICEQEVHAHTLICYSDPTADLETAEDWEKTFADAELTGDWGQDVVAIAKTQLGYEESTKNYLVEGETAKGYTRYGAWYGIPYGDWCAMFASFCLEYAGVEGMPLDASCPNWINTLNNQNLYHVSGGYAPQSGDLIFFDWNANGSSDHVGIVVEFTPADGDTQATVRTIEGNSGNCVKYNTYSMDDATILGYGALPIQLTEEARAQVDHVISLIDAMPSADEINAKIEEFEEAEDYEAEEAWLTEVYQQVAEAYYYYDQLSDTQRSFVTNADKLLELEYIWSVTPYIDEIISDAPTAIASASTKDFIELNLYDYDSNVNTNYNNNNAWPGFQWNGGAYVPGATSANTSAKTYNRHAIDFIDFGNSIITDNTYGGNKYSFDTNSVSKNRWNIGNQGGNINAIVEYPEDDYANKPVGMSTGTEVLGRNLTTAGYPWVTNAGSMVEYFTNSSFSTKQNTESIDGLFQINSTTGGYFYNSRWNHAQYGNNKFTLYEDIITPNFITYPFGNFLPLNDITNGSTATQVSKIKYVGGNGNVGYVQQIINDLWYDTSLRNQSTGEWYDATADQLVAMLAKYRENLRSVTTTGGTAWTTWTAKDAIYDYIGNGPTDDTGPITDALLEKMYNIDWDVATNFFFGMEMKMKFMQPKDGLTGYDNGNNATGTWKVNSNGDEYLTGDPDGISDYPMHFYFTGDDDVWVYIDGVLFLDLSGIHRHVGGEIDFVEGKVHYYALEPATGDVATTPYATYTFAQLLTAAGKSTEGVLNSNGTFIDYSIHTFNFYYMERGSGSSVCRLNFNFPLLRKNTISVSKENVTTTGVAADEVVVGNPDYYFNLMSTESGKLFVGPDSVTGVTEYTVADSDGNILKNADGTDKIFQTDQYGIFKLKAGQTAYFEGITENSGTYYVQELIREEDNIQYPEVYVNDTISRYNKLIDWSGRTYFSDSDDDPYTGPYGYKWYGRSGQDTDAGANAAYHFQQQNRLDVAKLGKLQITKELIEAVPTRAITYYKMYVTLDGELLPVGLEYDVNGSTRTVTEAGCIEIAAGETATISNIVSGTAFHVVEDSASAAGYTVKYELSGAEATSNGSGGISGVVHVGTSQTVAVKVINSDSGAQVEIPVTKTFHKADSTNREFTFTLEQVTDASGETPADSGTKLNTTIATPAATNGNFDLTYFSKEFDIGTTTLYYKITETGTTADTLANTQAFIVEVAVTKAEGETGITAAVRKIYPLGSPDDTAASAVFVNTITGDLKLEKIVDGGTEAQTNDAFNFTIALDSGDSGVELKSSYPATVTQANGDIVETSFAVDNGVISINEVHHGESVVIHDLPIGTTWTITESRADGYNVKTMVTAGETVTNSTGVETNGTIFAGDTFVVYTNQQLYALPETGGTGTHVYTMAGLMLLLMSTAFLLYRYRKRRREVF